MMPPTVVAPSSRFEETQSRFGRIYAPDVRDANYPMERALRAMKRAELKVRTQAPRRGPTLDQDGPRCVKFSIATSLSAQPMHYTNVEGVSVKRVEVEVEGHRDLYDYAQYHDEWPGADYDGTSVRAGMQYICHPQVALASNYVWARTWEELIDYIKRVGSAPPVLGIDWTEGMDNPVKIGNDYYIEPTGRVLGGHAICALWFDKKRDALKLQQTWGKSYASNGIVYLKREHAQTVIFMWNGEAASYTETLAKAA